MWWILKELPVKVDDVVEIKILGLGKKGDGVGKHKGFAVIIPETEVGDWVKARITKVLPNCAFAQKTDE